jgi:hypothetical protein
MGVKKLIGGIAIYPESCAGESIDQVQSPLCGQSSTSIWARKFGDTFTIKIARVIIHSLHTLVPFNI